MTIKQQERTAEVKYTQYENSSDYSLDCVYGRYSQAKQQAWNYCENLMQRRGGWGLKVVTHNLNIFTAGFMYEDKDTGCEMFMYITPNYDIAIPVYDN